MINETITVTLYGKLLTFRDTDKKFELEGNLLKMNTKNYNVYLANLSDKKFLLVFAKEKYFGEKIFVNKKTRVETLIRLPKSPAIIDQTLEAKTQKN